MSSLRFFFFFCEDKGDKKKPHQNNGWLLGTIYLGCFLTKHCVNSSMLMLVQYEATSVVYLIRMIGDIIEPSPMSEVLNHLSRSYRFTALHELDVESPRKLDPSPRFSLHQLEPICCLCDEFFPN